MWTVYILKCADDSLYTGVTTDILRRLNEHNDTESPGKGARYTRGRRPVSLAYAEELESRSLACKREAAIKRLKRKQKLSLISRQKILSEQEIVCLFRGFIKR